MRARSERRPLIRSGLAVPTTLTVVVALLLLGSSVAGLLFGAQSLYDQEKLAAWLGQDIISLVVGLPLLLGSLFLARRGSLKGLLFWMGTLFYVVYGYAYYVFGLRFNPLFLVYVALVSLSLYSLLWLLVGADADAIKARFRESLPNRAIGGYCVGIAVMFALFWSGAIFSTIASGRSLDPVLRLVSTLDFLMPLPTLFISGVLLWRRHSWGYALGGLILVKATFTALTLLFNGWLAMVRGGELDPFMIPYAITAIGGLACSAAYFRSIAGEEVVRGTTAPTTAG